MCGILGYFRKSAGTDDHLGATMLRMLEALGRRGPDSAGVALVGPAHGASYIVRVQAGDELEMSQQAIEANREAIQMFAAGAQRRWRCLLQWRLCAFRARRKYRACPR